MAKQVLANTTDVGSERLHGDGEGEEPKKLWNVVDMRNQPNLPEFLKSYSMTEGKVGGICWDIHPLEENALFYVYGGRLQWEQVSLNQGHENMIKLLCITWICYMYLTW